MRNIRLTIEYDGKDFGGWQKQPNKLNIQGEIERAIENITGEKVDLIASGRTDAGVHAFAQIANFKTDSDMDIEKIPIEYRKVIYQNIIDLLNDILYTKEQILRKFNLNNSEFEKLLSEL